MQFLLLFNERKGTPPPEEAGLVEMTKYSGELRSRGVLRRGGPLAPASAAAGVRMRDGEALVTDGPFVETKEVVGGFCIIEVADRAEALEIARRCPHVLRGPIELHAVRERYTFADPEDGSAFLFAFRMEPGLSDPDGARKRQMIRFAEALARDRTLFEIAPLSDDPPAARIETAAGKLMVTDGPFAETKDAIGGYALVRTSGKAAAIALAKQFPHASWGPVEVREILFFDPV